MTLEEHIAKAIAKAFWETAEQPRHWATMSQQQRQVFMMCAEAAVAAGREFRELRASGHLRPNVTNPGMTTHA